VHSSFKDTHTHTHTHSGDITAPFPFSSLQPIQNEFGEGFLHRGRLQLGTDNLGADDFAHIRMVAPTALNRGSGQSSTAQLETRTDTRGTLPNDGDGVNGANGGPQHDDPQDCIVQYLFR
jgi:hypothetical protein